MPGSCDLWLTCMPYAKVSSPSQNAGEGGAEFTFEGNIGKNLPACLYSVSRFVQNDYELS